MKDCMRTGWCADCSAAATAVPSVFLFSQFFVLDSQLSRSSRFCGQQGIITCPSCHSGSVSVNGGLFCSGYGIRH